VVQLPATLRTDEPFGRAAVGAAAGSGVRVGVGVGVGVGLGLAVAVVATAGPSGAVGVDSSVTAEACLGNVSRDAPVAVPEALSTLYPFYGSDGNKP
jgi:hypothetical protein